MRASRDWNDSSAGVSVRVGTAGAAANAVFGSPAPSAGAGAGLLAGAAARPGFTSPPQLGHHGGNRSYASRPISQAHCGQRILIVQSSINATVVAKTGAMLMKFTSSPV